MLTDEDEGTFGLPYEMFRWAVAARLVGCRLAFLSVGVEPMHRPLTRFFIRTALRLAMFRSYRDGQSRARLSKAGFFSERDAVRPDLAFSLLDLPTASPVPRKPGARPTVAVGIYDFRRRGTGSPGDAAAYRAYLEKLCTLVDELTRRGHPVRIIIGDNAYDEPVLADLRAALQRRGIDGGSVGIEDAPAASFQELLEQLHRTDLVVASRFHNVVLALLLGRSVVSLSYNEKNDALMADMGLGDFCQRIDDFQIERVLEQLLDLQARADRLHPVVAAKAAQYRRELGEQYDRLLGQSDGRSDGSGPRAVERRPG
jgi:polysaccharide pyruvyl transferase WcaK-like protein